MRVENTRAPLLTTMSVERMHPLREKQLWQIWELGTEILDQIAAFTPSPLRFLAEQTFRIDVPTLLAFRSSPERSARARTGQPFGWLELGINLGRLTQTSRETRLKSNALQILRIGFDLLDAEMSNFEADGEASVLLRIPFQDLHRIGSQLVSLCDSSDLFRHLNRWTPDQIRTFLADPFFVANEDGRFPGDTGQDWRDFASELERAIGNEALGKRNLPELIRMVERLLGELRLALDADEGLIDYDRVTEPRSMDPAEIRELAARYLARGFAFQGTPEERKALKQALWEFGGDTVSRNEKLVLLLAIGIEAALKTSAEPTVFRRRYQKHNDGKPIIPCVDLSPADFDIWLEQRAKSNVPDALLVDEPEPNTTPASDFAPGKLEDDYQRQLDAPENAADEYDDNVSARADRRLAKIRERGTPGQQARLDAALDLLEASRDRLDLTKIARLAGESEAAFRKDFERLKAASVDIPVEMSRFSNPSH